MSLPYRYTSAKVLSVKGFNGWVITSYERAPHITCYGGFIGKWRMPLLIIFSCGTAKPWWLDSVGDLEEELQVVVWIAATDNGWITSDIKLEYEVKMKQLPDYPGNNLPPGRMLWRTMDGHYTNLCLPMAKHMHADQTSQFGCPPSHTTSGTQAMDAEGGLIQNTKDCANKLIHNLNSATAAALSTDLQIIVRAITKGYIEGAKESTILTSMLKVGYLPTGREFDDKSFDELKQMAKSGKAKLLKRMWDAKVKYDPLSVIDPTKLAAGKHADTLSSLSLGGDGLTRSGRQRDLSARVGGIDGFIAKRQQEMKVAETVLTTMHSASIEVSFRIQWLMVVVS